MNTVRLQKLAELGDTDAAELLRAKQFRKESGLHVLYEHFKTGAEMHFLHDNKQISFENLYFPNDIFVVYNNHKTKLNWADKTKRLFAADCAERVLHLFEEKYPEDKRPRKAIRASSDFAYGKISKEELKVLCAAALNAADAAYAAYAAAAYAAAYARKEEKAWQKQRLIEYWFGQIRLKEKATEKS